MNKDLKQPSKFWAYIAIIVGALLLFAGIITTVSFLGLPLLRLGDDILGPQLGQIAGMFLGVVCGTLALYHGLGSILKRRSSPFRLAPAHILLIFFAIVLGVGNVVLEFNLAAEFLFPPLFALGAALPTLIVLTWTLRRLGWPVTWRQAALAFVAGSTPSILIAIILETTLPFIVYMLVSPLESLVYTFGDVFGAGTSGILERLFSTPLILIFLLFTAFQAPIPEEFAKALGVTFFGRQRITNERKAFAIGLAAGAGFAILENMLYEGLYAQWSGWTWGGITLLRGIGSVLHPLCTGLVTLGWFRAREAGWGELVKSYFLAVGLHTLWNGGFMPFVYLTGLDYFSGYEETFSIYGLAVEGMLVIFLVALSIFLWWFLRRTTDHLAEEVIPQVTTMIVTPRTVAIWSLVCVLVIIPIGAALGPAWRDIQAVIFPGW